MGIKASWGVKCNHCGWTGQLDDCATRYIGHPIKLPDGAMDADVEQLVLCPACGDPDIDEAEE